MSASQISPRDQNFVTAALFESSTVPGTVYAGQIDQVTGRILTDSANGSGTVTSVSVVTANGFAGTVATATTTPAITLTTSINAPILAGNGTALSAATTTGSGSTAVLQTSPTLITPVLGVATATTINKVTLTAPATGSTLTIAEGKTLTQNATQTFAGVDGKTLTFNNSITFAGTDSTTMTFPTTSATIARTDAANTFTGVQTMTSPAITTSITTGSTTFTAFAGATTLLTIGGTGASSVFAIPGTLEQSGTTGSLTVAGGVYIAKVLQAASTIELGAATDTTLSRSSAGVLAVEGVVIPSISSTNTLTNKRIQPRTASSTTASTLTPDVSTANVYFRTTQTATLTIDAPIGTPVIGEVITIYVDSAGAQTLTINATYKVFGAAFPATTTAGKTFMLQAQYNGTSWLATWASAV